MKIQNGFSMGISAHTPYTVCPQALSDLAGWSADKKLPLAIHLAESPEERDLLLKGSGRLRDLLREIAGRDPVDETGVGAGAIERAQEAEALGARTLAIHCNLPEYEDLERLAGSRAAVVFCPCSHRFFGYPPYPLAEYREAGVRLALGTDSLSSNAQLSMRAEAREVLNQDGTIPPLDLLGLMTGAALGNEAPYGGRGRLAAAGLAQWAVWRLPQLAELKSNENAMQMMLDPGTNCVRSSALV